MLPSELAGERGSVGKGGPGVGQGSLADHLSRSIKNADVMGPITKIKPEGEPTANSGRGGGNERRCFIFVFVRQNDITRRVIASNVCLLI